MRTGLAVIVATIVAVIAACGGYWLGFREAWSMGIRADAAPKGVVAIGQLRLIEQGRVDDLRGVLENDIDTGLILWRDLSTSPLRPIMNQLSGTEVFPEYEQYVRKLATYRKSHKSPLSNPAAVRELGQSTESASRAIDEVVKKYAQ
jgi:hypothetical protein